MKKIVAIILFSLSLFVLTGCITFVKVERKATLLNVSVPEEITAKDFNLTDLSMTVYFDDDTSTIVKITESMLVSPTIEELSVPGEYLIKLTYEEAFVEFNITLLEKYKDIVITFYCLEEQYSNITIPGKTQLQSLPDITQKGYKFDGWYHEPYFKTKVEITDIYLTDSSVYARFIPLGNKVVFDYSCEEFETKEFVITTGEKLAEIIPYRTGYEFLGWYVTIEEETIKYDFENIVDSDMTLVAHWKEIT